MFFPKSWEGCHDASFLPQVHQGAELAVGETVTGDPGGCTCMCVEITVALGKCLDPGVEDDSCPTPLPSSSLTLGHHL